MSRISEFMSRDVRFIEPQETVRRAALLMRELDVGALPVCQGDRLLGMLTDRDIAVRCVANGADPNKTCASDMMSPDAQFCTEDQDAQEVLRIMGEKQLRRLPVVDAQQGLVGIVSLGDLALHEVGQVDQAVQKISLPDKPEARH